MFKLKQSYQELFQISCIVNTGVLLAVSIVLGSLSVSIGSFLRISFAVLPQQIVCFLYGPVIGIVFGFISDILRFVINPSGPFFPGFTISSMLYGIVYGFFLYQSNFSYKNIIIANVISALIVNIGLNTYWLSLLYSQPYMILLPIRIMKESFVLPIEVILSVLVIKHIRPFFQKNFKVLIK